MISSDFPWLGKVHPRTGHEGPGGSGGLEALGGVVIHDTPR